MHMHPASPPSADRGSESIPAFDARRREVRDDPYPEYERLRRDDPVHRGAGGAWVVTRYGDVAMVLSDHERFSNDLSVTALHRSRQRALGEQGQQLESDFSMLRMDPPEHTRLRRVVQQGFSPRAVAALRARVDQLVDELLTQVERAGSMDVIAQFAYPLPVTVICELLGVPTGDRPLLYELTHQMLDDDAMVTESAIATEQREAIARSLAARLELEGYFAELVAQQRPAPAPGLVGDLLAAEHSDKLSERELVQTCVLLLVAGHVTTVNLIGNGTLALLRHPDQRRRLIDDPALTRTAVEELLRYDSPVQNMARAAAQDIELHGRTIRRGELVLAQVGSANRDPARFRQPDQLDLSRQDNGHVAFGKGIHFCLGAPLARLEGQIAIPALLRRFPRLELATDHLRWTGSFLRGLHELPVTF